MKHFTRREILRGSTGAVLSAGLSGWNGLKPAAGAELQQGRLTHRDDAALQRLADRISEAEPQRAFDLIATELENGLSSQLLLAANFLTGIRFQGHHYAYVAHPVKVVSQALPAEMSLLPMFYHLESLKVRRARDLAFPVDQAKIASIRKPAESFHAAMSEGDRMTAIHSFLALAREFGPRRAYRHLWMYGVERNHGTGGHAAISVINTFRTAQAIDWRCAENVLQFAIQDTVYHQPRGSDLHAVNKERANRERELPGDWSRARSRSESVLDLLAVYREGRPEEACRQTFELLQQGKIQAGSVWDAVFLTTAETTSRYVWVGSKRLAGHSITCTNALHFVYRTVDDPVTRLYAVLEAVQWTTSFLDRERARSALRERSIIDIATADLTAEDESPDRIFSIVPRRPRSQFSPALLPDADRAQELAFAWARQNGDHTPFFQQALRLLCLKSTTEVHDFKYPLALFENYRYASPEWKPHLLAASVYVIHGTRMENAPMVEQARERLGIG